MNKLMITRSIPNKNKALNPKKRCVLHKAPRAPTARGHHRGNLGQKWCSITGWFRFIYVNNTYRIFTIYVGLSGYKVVLYKSAWPFKDPYTILSRGSFLVVQSCSTIRGSTRPWAAPISRSMTIRKANILEPRIAHISCKRAQSKLLPHCRTKEFLQVHTVAKIYTKSAWSSFWAVVWAYPLAPLFWEAPDPQAKTHSAGINCRKTRIVRLPVRMPNAAALSHSWTGKCLQNSMLLSLSLTQWLKSAAVHQCIP